MKTLIRIPIFLAAALAASAFADIKVPYNESISTEGVQRVEINLFAGHANILGDDQKTVDLDIKQVAKTSSQSEADEWVSEIERTIETRGNTLYITFRHPNNRTSSWFSFGNNKCYLEADISLPSHLDIKVHTAGGHLEARHLSGEINLSTSGGHLSFADISGPITGRTSGGHIEALRLEGAADLRTSGGHIKIDTATQPLNLHTSGGHINIQNISAAITAKTSGGHINATFISGFNQDSSLKTSGGSIKAKLPANHSFDIHAATSGGGVHLDSKLPINGEIKRSSVNGSINGGGPSLELKTSGGSINISTI